MNLPPYTRHCVSPKSKLRMRAAEKVVAERESIGTSAHHAGNKAELDADCSQWSGKRINAYRQSLATYSNLPTVLREIPTLRPRAIEEPAGSQGLPGGIRSETSASRVIAIGLFPGLREMALAGTVDPETTDANRTYTVDQIEVVKADDVSVLKATSTPSLMSVTCYPFYPAGDAPVRSIVSASPDEEVLQNSNVGLQDFGSPKKGTKMSRKSILVLSAVFAFAVITAGTRAQDTSTTTVKHGPSERETSVRNAEVVYASGNDLVLKLEDGKVEHMVVPDNSKFHINGREVSVHDLQPGTKLTETITTTTTPRIVTNVRNIEGRVFHVNAPHTVVLTSPDGTNQSYRIPNDQKFTINGQEKTAFDLKRGMNVSATVVTDSPETVLSQSKKVTGQAPTPPTPTLVGALLFVPRPAAERHRPAGNEQ